MAGRPGGGAIATITSAPWRRAPRLLLRRPSVLLSAAGACLVLTAAMAAVPLFLSSAGTAALERQQVERCAGGAGASMNVVSEPDDFVAAAGATSRGRRELSPPILTYLPLNTISVTGAGESQSWLARLVHRTDAQDHVSVVERADLDGVWVPDTLAENVGVRAGDPINLSSLGAPVAIPVAAVYRDLTTQPLDDYWCPLESTFAATNPYGDRPPPAILADERLTLELFGDLDIDAVAISYEVRADPRMTLTEARDLAAFYRRWPGLIVEHVESSDLPSFAPAPLSSDLPFMSRRGQALRAAVGGGIVPVMVAAMLAAAGMVVAAGALWADRRQQELVLLRGRGVGPGAIGLKAMLELSPAIALGSLVGFGLAYIAVRELGPTPRFEPASVRLAAVFALGAALLAALLFMSVAAARSRPRAAHHPGRRWHLGVVPWELGFGVAAVIAYGRLGSIGAPSAEGADVRNVDALALAFPLLFLAACLGLIVRLAGRWLGHRATAARPARWSVYLAARRLAAGRAAAVTFFAASALAFGVLLYASTLTRSLTATLEAKVRTFVGSATVVQLSDVDSVVPSTLDGVATRVLRTAGDLEGEDVEILAVDPSTFADGAFWDATYSSISLEELLDRLAPSRAEPVPVVAVGWDPGRGPELALPGGDQERAVEMVGEARLFPSDTSTRRLLVMSQDSLASFGPDVRATVEVWSTASSAVVAAALSDADVGVSISRSTEDIVNQTVFLTVAWTFGFMQSLGVVAGVITIGGLAIYLDARRRARTLGYAFLRRMGLRRRAHRRALFLEIAATVLVGCAAGVVLALAAGWLVHGRLDPADDIPPGTLLRIPYPLLAATIAVTFLVCVVGAAAAQRLTDRDDPAEVLRAGT